MKLSDKEASVKMAGIAGKKLFERWDGTLWVDSTDEFWSPRENIAQMMEVGDKLKGGDFALVIQCLNTYSVTVLRESCILNNIESDSLGEAIFQAVKKWMESEG